MPKTGSLDAIFMLPLINFNDTAIRFVCSKYFKLNFNDSYPYPCIYLRKFVKSLLFLYS